MKTMKSQSRRSGGADRGGIRKRGPTRTDRDGDMDMDTSARGGKGGRGKPARSSTARPSGSGRTQPRDKNIDAIQRAISGAKDSQFNIRSGKNANATNLEEYSVRGWKDSKASSTRDGGVDSLLGFLERRMNAHTKSGSSRARITKSRVEGDSLIVSVKPDVGTKLSYLDGNTFAGVKIIVERYDPASSEALDRELRTTNGLSQETIDTKTKMTEILARRYFPDPKLLDLSKLGTDPDLQAMGIFNSTSTESKFFPALMKVWEMGFADAKQRREAVESVSLADNKLANITVVTTLAVTIPGLKNLDLSNNNFKDASSLIGWRWKFRDLEFLDLTGNPYSTVESFKSTMMKWYPKLQTLNNVQVRTPEEIAAQKKTPIPVQPPHFQDDSQIAENFVRAFFTGYDTDRNILLNTIYDDRSTFSMNINTSAPKATQADTASWDPYIKRSRNLQKISHLPARMARTFTGKEKIAELWSTLPATRHPDMAVHPEEMLIECHPVPGLPDHTGQSETGVGGLLVMVHGKFEESVGGKVETRSFDRSFTIGPGSGALGITVINDILTLRAYGGHEAWSPENQAIPNAIPQAIPQAIAPPSVAAPITPVALPVMPVAPHPSFPAGYGLPAPGKTDTQIQQEQMISQISAKSGMTIQYSEMALSSNGWNLDAAWNNFEQLKAQGALPADAFLPVT
ncbi:nuclear mRNA export poly(A)+RNA binding protein [Penicillium odoratum]|uniref:nuclear mRNA export poly(A)+RNA binding protein n=1 Tax=Penicillium odoratum TaxID=1167516 RepID=UPI002546A743|nr:nuclear mRNA export poly(A)+RNA binding protein [Penicillium odoratum]KAJ5758951.1 nuclear mRNA export poly(A)+RNA binding protein [Penicillium odoratum]